MGSERVSAQLRGLSVVSVVSGVSVFSGGSDVSGVSVVDGRVGGAGLSWRKVSSSGERWPW